MLLLFPIEPTNSGGVAPYYIDSLSELQIGLLLFGKAQNTRLVCLQNSNFYHFMNIKILFAIEKPMTPLFS